MKNLQLKKRYNKNRNNENWYFYNKQRNICVSLLRKTKTNYFKSVKMQDITGNEQFWKIIWSYFSDKGYNQTKITNCRKRFYYGRQKKYNSNE